MKFLRIFLFVFFFITAVWFLAISVKASHCSASDLDCQIQEIQREIDALKPAHETNKQELANLRAQLSSLNKRIASISNQLKSLEGEISQREEELAFTQEIFEEKASNHYRFIRLYDPILPFLASEDAASAFREINFRQRAADEDRKTMEKYAEELAKLKNDKENLEKNKASLAAAQKKIGDQEKFLAGEVAKVESYLATLTAKQQQFIAQKLGSLNLPRTLGAGPLFCTDDRNLDPGSLERPAFAFYTFGIPHYVGMNQYGAYGRATFDNQDYRTILQAYYGNTSIECRDVPATISVQGYGDLPFEEYIKGVVNKEMGADIPEALKAQALAARSYALNQPLPICTTQYCQVYSSARRGAANSAVDATGVVACGAGKAEVLVSGGQIITAWYASTFGGYTQRSSAQLPNAGNTSYTKNFADAQGSIGSFPDLFAKAYDRESKCFYAAQGWRSGYGNSAWLSHKEVADIVNVILLARRDSSTREHLYQTDKPNPAGTDTWSVERVKEELRNRGGTPFNSISTVSVNGVDWSSGITTSLTVSGDGGSESFSGTEFKDFFNLRAPANIQIVGPLFNVERKG